MKKLNKGIIVILIFVYFVFSIGYIVNLVCNYEKNLNKDSNEYFPFYDRIISLNSYINSKINKRLTIKHSGKIYDYYYKYSDQNILHFTDLNINNSQRVSKKLIKLNKYLTDNNIKFLYIETPKKEYFYRDVLNYYSFDYHFSKESVIYDNLNKEKINFIIGNFLLENDDNKREDLYYKLDYHWTSKTSLYFAKKMIDCLNNTYDYHFDTSALNYNNFHKIVYKNSYYGYYGRLLGQSSDSFDDFTIYVPNKSPNYTVYYGKDRTTVSGSFLNTLYDVNQYSLSTHQPYVYQIGGMQPNISIKNNDLNQTPKILFIYDSMFYSLAPYLSLSIGNFDAIDIRTQNGNFSENIKEYIKNSNPDCVIYMADISLNEDLDKLNF